MQGRKSLESAIACSTPEMPLTIQSRILDSASQQEVGKLMPRKLIPAL